MPLVERATVTECDRCERMGYSPITDDSFGRYPTVKEGWLVVEQSWEKTEKAPATLQRLVFCGWACLAEYASDADDTGQAMLVEGT